MRRGRFAQVCSAVYLARTKIVNMLVHVSTYPRVRIGTKIVQYP